MNFSSRSSLPFVTYIIILYVKILSTLTLFQFDRISFIYVLTWIIFFFLVHLIVRGYFTLELIGLSHFRQLRVICNIRSPNTDIHFDWILTVNNWFPKIYKWVIFWTFDWCRFVRGSRWDNNIIFNYLFSSTDIGSTYLSNNNQHIKS